MTFPPIPFDENTLTLTGYLKYTPSVTFDEAVMQELQDVLVEACEIDDCENPQVIADWREVVRNDEGRIMHRSNIILYRDGADGAEEEDGCYENIGLLFCRQDIDQTTSPFRVQYRVHIPTPNNQDTLLGCCEAMFSQMQRGDASGLKTIREYLQLTLNNQAIWDVLEIDDEDEKDGDDE